jgi:hypothetical protein
MGRRTDVVVAYAASSIRAGAAAVLVWSVGCGKPVQGLKHQRRVGPDWTPMHTEEVCRGPDGVWTPEVPTAFVELHLSSKASTAWSRASG